MSYRQRLSLFVLADSCIVLIAIFIARYLISSDLSYFSFAFLFTSSVIVISQFLYSLASKLYKKVWQYASVGEMVIIFKIVVFTYITTAVSQYFFIHDIFLRLLTVTALLQLLFIGGSRFCWRYFCDHIIAAPYPKKRTVIIGAGSAGIMVARQLLKKNDTDLLLVAFVDDDRKKQELDILGLPVAGGISQIGKIVVDRDIDHIIIAIPSLSRTKLNAIIQECAKTKAKTQILPMLEDIVTGKVSVSQFRDVQVEDLLGREPVNLDMARISGHVTNKVVLVTGAGGSIGSEICRQISAFSPRQLILLGHGENSIYAIAMELKGRNKDSPIEMITEIADLQDAEKMQKVMETYHPDVVYHAAAHKHVPLMERNPEEAVKNNVIGTKNVAEAASRSGVKTFVMISTDKAVKPTSVMGATKRMAEMIIQHLDKISATKFVAVRFGNVLGSRGSVIPLFRKQIEEGGPVTVTHPDMVRYFMTIPEASRLVIQAGAFARGGEIFVLDMGEPVKIVDLAKNLIRLSGNSIEDIGIVFTGIRPGEKLFEELLAEDEVLKQQVYPKIYIGKSSVIYIEQINEMITNYRDYKKKELREALIQLANGSSNRKIIMPVSS
ncbi:polysaccharide biosynthesis protein [Bacillaceae bacterium Marseille-Q3522]|nr:polysaccharide biosynthesis protein [Bacillaceae bacterium Marseille-Q3522]